jgi:hypothetical protein
MFHICSETFKGPVQNLKCCRNFGNGFLFHFLLYPYVPVPGRFDCPGFDCPGRFGCPGPGYPDPGVGPGLDFPGPGFLNFADLENSFVPGLFDRFSFFTLSLKTLKIKN